MATTSSTSSTFSSLGVGTGIDLSSMLTKLMAVEQLPLTQLNSKISDTNTKISAYGQLKSSLSSLQTAAQALFNPLKLNTFSVSSSDETVMTASTSITAAPGKYSVNVASLATAQKDFTQGYATNKQFATAGSLVFTVGGVQKDPIAISANASLQDIRSAINSANLGVSASIISNGTVNRLVLSGTTEGSANAFSLSVTGGDTDLQSLATFDRTTAGLAYANATDASLTIDGISITSSTNTIADKINGVTLNLLQTGTSTIKVVSDSTSLTKAAQSLVDAYNSVASYIKTNTAYNASTKVAQPLNAESTVRSIQGLLSSARTTVPTSLSSATFKTLSEIGLAIQSDGTMALDTTKLQSAIATSSEGVKQTLAAYGTAFDTEITAVIGTSGLVKSRIDGLTASITRYNSQATALQKRIDLTEARYRKQFTALDTLMGSLQTTSTYLTQQLANL